MRMSSSKYRLLPLIMWLCPLSFVVHQFILRLWPSIVIDDMMIQFNIDSSDMGIFAASYYYGYAIVQIPMAILLKRFGVRSIVFVFTVLCGIAVLVTSYTTNFYLAVFCRFIIGLGSSIGFLGVTQILSEWFTKEQYTNMIGFTFTIGLLGAVYGGKPISLLVEQYGSHDVSIVLALISITIGLISYAVLRSPPSITKTDDEFSFDNLMAVFKSKNTWYLAIANLLMVGVLGGFADVWGVQYLVQAYQLSTSDAAGLVSFVFIGMVVGGPLLAACSRKVGDYTVMIGCGISMGVLFAVLLLYPTYDYIILAALLFVIGIICCYQVIILSLGARMSEQHNVGVTVAFLNCMNMLGGAFFHMIIGVSLDMLWSEEGPLGSIIYSVESYQYALSVISICSILGALIVYIMKKTSTKIMMHE